MLSVSIWYETFVCYRIFFFTFRLALFHLECFNPAFTTGFTTKEAVPAKFKTRYSTFLHDNSQMNLWHIVGRSLLQ